MQQIGAVKKRHGKLGGIENGRTQLRINFLSYQAFHTDVFGCVETLSQKLCLEGKDKIKGMADQKFRPKR